MRPEIISLIRNLSGTASSAEFTRSSVNNAVYSEGRKGYTSEMGIRHGRAVCGAFKCGQKGIKCGK